MGGEREAGGQQLLRGEHLRRVAVGAGGLVKAQGASAAGVRASTDKQTPALEPTRARARALDAVLPPSLLLPTEARPPMRAVRPS